MKERKDVEGLIKELNTNKNLKVRIEVVKAFRELKYSNGLMKALRNDDPEIRVEAISALDSIDKTEAAKALVNVLLTESIEYVWQKAFMALSTFTTGDMRKTWINLAMELLKNNAYQNALICFEKVEEISPDKETIVGIGGALMDCGKNEDALPYFKKFLNIAPEDERGWGGIASCLLELEKYEEALNYAKKAMDINPKNLGVRNILSSIYLKREEYEELALLSKGTLQINSKELKAYVALSEALSFLGKMNEALSELKKALEVVHQQEWIKPEDLNIIHHQLGIVYAMKGERDEALSHFQEALGALPNDEWARQLKESYKILDIIGLALKRTPEERRGRLLGLASQRTEARERGYNNATEKVVAEIGIEDARRLWGDSTLSDLNVIKGMLRFWPSEYFNGFRD
jgi:tetratricopeptide (TPR) repeat protein